MRRLQELDEVAYVRFASVYRSFRDIAEFMSELKDLLETEPQGGAKDRNGARAPGRAEPRCGC